MATHLRCAPSLAAALIVLCATMPVAAKTVDVTASGMSFSPSTISLEVGDSVTIHNNGGFHNVAADDGSFRCANGCDDQSGDGDPSSSAWTFTRTFTQAATIPFHCEIHGTATSGMRGTIVVSGPSSGNNGALQFSSPTYSVTEGSAQAQIAVGRTGGDDGAVSVHYATSAQSATAGADFTGVSGSLTWADHDDASKTFAVPIANDALVEANETVLLTLSLPTGGATLGTSTAVLTLFDNDTPGVVPASPTGLRSTATTQSAITLAWQDRSSNETRFRVEGKALGQAAFVDRGTVAANTTSLLVSGLAPGTAYLFRVRAENATGVSASSPEVLATTDEPPSPCVPSAGTLCVNGGRFRVSIVWRTPTASGSGGAIPLPANPDSGLFYFFSPANIEALIKVLNACTSSAPRYWAFFAATTNVEFTLRVSDTQTGKARTYFNPLGQAAAPVQDTDAFATCP